VGECGRPLGGIWVTGLGVGVGTWRILYVNLGTPVEFRYHMSK